MTIQIERAKLTCIGCGKRFYGLINLYYGQSDHHVERDISVKALWADGSGINKARIHHHKKDKGESRDHGSFNVIGLRASPDLVVNVNVGLQDATVRGISDTDLRFAVENELHQV